MVISALPKLGPSLVLGFHFLGRHVTGTVKEFETPYTSTREAESLEQGKQRTWNEQERLLHKISEPLLCDNAAFCAKYTDTRFLRHSERQTLRALRSSAQAQIVRSESVVTHQAGNNCNAFLCDNPLKKVTHGCPALLRPFPHAFPHSGTELQSTKHSSLGPAPTQPLLYAEACPSLVSIKTCREALLQRALEAHCGWGLGLWPDDLTGQPALCA